MGGKNGPMALPSGSAKLSLVTRGPAGCGRERHPPELNSESTWLMNSMKSHTSAL